GLMRDKWDERHGEQTYGQLTIARALETVTAQYRPRDNGASRGARRVATSTEDDERPQILIDTEEHVVVAKTIEALQSDADIFQRGGVLVRVIRDCVPGDDIRRARGSATIQLLPAANLRERMTRLIRFTRINKQGIEVPAHPTAWLVSAVRDRGEWDGIR